MTQQKKLQSRVCEILEIDRPIVLAGMGGASSPALAAAVSNAGGLGIITALTVAQPPRGAEALRDEVRGKFWPQCSYNPLSDSEMQGPYQEALRSQHHASPRGCSPGL